jgi:CarD family transcriptional regulator
MQRKNYQNLLTFGNFCCIMIMLKKIKSFIYIQEGVAQKAMFNVGDHIVYPMHGAGVIDAIEEKNILGEKQAYYILKMPGEVKVMVPTSKAEEIGVRGIVDKQSADKVFEILEEDKTEMSSNWNKRYRDNMDKMKSGDIYEVADVVRNLSFKQKEKGLSTGEKKMLSNAKQILVSELVLAENSSIEEVEGMIDNKINSSFQEFEIDTIEPVQNVVNKFIPFNESAN